MAYPTKHFPTLQDAFDKRIAALKADFVERLVPMAAGAVALAQVLAVLRLAVAVGAAIVSHKAAVSGTAGFAQYVADAKGISTTTLSTEINAVQTALATVETEARAAIPKNAGGLVIYGSLDASGGLVERTLDTTATLALRNAMTTVVNSIG